MQKYPKGNCRYEWLQSYFEENMSKDFFEVPMASETVKLLNMFFGVCLGQHFVLDKEDEVKPWFVAYGEPKSLAKVSWHRFCRSLYQNAPLLFLILPHLPNSNFFRGDRLMWTCRVPDPTGPLYNTLDFRCFDHGARFLQTSKTATLSRQSRPWGKCCQCRQAMSISTTHRFLCDLQKQSTA